MAIDSKDLIEEFNELYTARKQWEDHWQIVGKLVHGLKQNFTETRTDGERLNEDINDSTGIFANRALASALIGMLWPNGAKSVRLDPVKSLPESAEIKAYYDAITDKLVTAMDDPAANLALTLDEYMLDQGAFGTSGIAAFKGEDSLLKFEAWGAKQIYVAEGREGRVDTVIRLFSWPLRKIIATYGVENLSKSLQDKAKSIKALKERYEIIHMVRPRSDRDKDMKDNKNMPFMSVHMERETEHIIKESGFEENPVKVARFRKLPYETYGRSPGTDCLSNMLELDYLTGRFTINVDKSGDPPLVVLDDGRLGGGTIDTSAGAINVIDISGRINANLNPVQPLQTVGELNTTLTRIDQLKEVISQHFFLDKLLDFNNETQMTASEALIRDKIRGSALGSVFNRQTSETFSPLVTRSVNVLFGEGELGVLKGSQEEAMLLAEGKEPIIIPDEVAKKMAAGEDFYEIKYFTPAARILQAQEMDSINQVLQFKAGLQQLNPEAGDLFNDDEALKNVARIAGVQAKILDSQEEADGKRAARQQQAQQAQQAQDAKAESEALKNVAQAEAV